MEPEADLPSGITGITADQCMKYRYAYDGSPEELRGNALASAVALRDCSLRTETSLAMRRACRTVMREQAIKWRRPAAGRALS